MEIGKYDHLHEIKYFKYDEYLKGFSIGIYHWGLCESDRCWTHYSEYLFEEAEKSFAKRQIGFYIFEYNLSALGQYLLY